MKKLIVFVFTFLIIQLHARADEGMWIPLLIGKNIADMQAKGCRLSAEDIYNANQSSLKDAVVEFGGGCTGEVISSQGLVLTNHHCGYGAIQRLSTLEKDYLTNGYAAMNKTEELPSPGLTVTFVVRIEDVTKRILDSLASEMTEVQRNKKIADISSTIEKEAVKETHYDAKVRSFFYGNEFYLFVTETFKDIRLVVAPPSAIGNFGGETDNWIWPRHTGDFSLFRIYAGKDNKPADYSADNVPYTPKKYFTISMTGVKEDDFAMVYGFPGRTTEYIPASAVDMIMNSTDPNRVEIRGFANSFSELIALAKKDSVKQNEIDLMVGNAKKRAEGFFKDYDERVDREMFAELLVIYRDSMKSEHLPQYFKTMNQKFKGDMFRFSEYVFSKSVFASKEKVLALLGSFGKSSPKKLEKDPAYALASAISENYDALTLRLPEINSAIAIQMRNYMAAQREMQAQKNFYPDANLTLRIAFGKVKGYRPNDGMNYIYRTTTDGIGEKFRTGNEEFYMPQKVLSMIDKKNFETYAVHDTLQVCFLTTSHTTGGNSGSPVINAGGELIGTNFDRLWEGTMSDVMFSPDRCRNIAVDIRYTLWVIDRVEGAGYLLNEMKLSSLKM